MILHKYSWPITNKNLIIITKLHKKCRYKKPGWWPNSRCGSTATSNFLKASSSRFTRISSRACSKTEILSKSNAVISFIGTHCRLITPASIWWKTISLTNRKYCSIWPGGSPISSFTHLWRILWLRLILTGWSLGYTLKSGEITT